ncbi:hypothetical protein [Paenibacillus sp. S150]|uniref:hypothetical protein n=1 Tax=Paenibacillus sp. S150 TaxID=2749826 RepID=UPI001C57CAAD|nr:hypothetical protein [Paenibacillus sp. S150]MBW4084446.1 hypothetical protein [Paenibacillus sp. S150]
MSGSYRVEPLDQIMYIAESGSDQQIRCYLEFDGQLDEVHLREAIFLSLELEEVLLHKLNKGFFKLSWEKMNDKDVGTVYHFLEGPADINSEIEAFFIQKIDTCRGPQILIRLFRNEGKDYLGFIIHHDVSDSTGLMHYIKKLGGIYNQLRKNQNYRPDSYKKVDRGIQSLLKKYNVMERFKSMLSTSDMKLETEIHPFPWSKPNDNNKERLLLHRVSPDRLIQINDYCKQQGCSFNDYFLTAFYKTFYTLRDQKCKLNSTINPLFLTIDFRNYNRTYQDNVIVNFSSGVLAQLKVEPLATFETILAEVQRFTKQIKVDLNNYSKQQVPGVNTVFMLNSLLKMIPFKVVEKMSGAMGKNVLGIPYLSNVGNINRFVDVWDDLKLEDAYFMGQIVYYPKFSLVFSQFKNTLTISAGFVGDEEDVRMIKKLYEILDQNLVQA